MRAGIATRGLLALAMLSAFAPARAEEERRPAWTGAGIDSMVPQMSRALGAVHAGAMRCGLQAEAAAVDAKHREHLDRVAVQVPGANTDLLRRTFEATAQAMRGPDPDCPDEERREIRAKLPDVLGSVDDFDSALTAHR